jgi:hypothetical protein
VGKEKKGGVVVGGGLHSGEQGKLVKDDWLVNEAG